MAVLEWLRFFWSATRGYRLRPVRSPYVRWRLETYTGKKAEDIRSRDVAALLWQERRQAIRFLRWLGEMRGLRTAGDHRAG